MIGHKKRQGKATLAKMLADRTGGEIVHFAGPLKQIIADTFGMTLGELEHAKDNPYEHYIQHSGWAEAWKDGVEFPLGDRHSYRFILQRFGAVMKKHMGENVWANMAIKRINSVGQSVIIMPDMRFVIEYLVICRYFRREDVVTVKVSRNCDNIGEDNHASETALDNFAFDYTISNDGTLDDLSLKAEELIKKLEERLCITKPS